MQKVRAPLAIILAGIGFFYVETFLIGFFTAIAYPTWYAEFVGRHSELGFAIWDLVTIVPVVVVSALLVGAVLARFVDSHYFLSGLAAIVVAIAFAIVLAAPQQGLSVAIRNHIFPVFWFLVPSHLAIWLALPLATRVFGASAEEVKIDTPNAPV